MEIQPENPDVYGKSARKSSILCNVSLKSLHSMESQSEKRDVNGKLA